MTIVKQLATGAVLAAAAVGLAGPAWAEELNGSYTLTVIDTDTREVDGRRPGVELGDVATWILTPCGPGCLHNSRQGGAQTDMHRQGNTWVEQRSPCSDSIDSDTLIVVSDCGVYGTFRSQLTKNG